MERVIKGLVTCFLRSYELSLLVGSRILGGVGFCRPLLGFFRLLKTRKFIIRFELLTSEAAKLLPKEG